MSPSSYLLWINMCIAHPEIMFPYASCLVPPHMTRACRYVYRVSFKRTVRLLRVHMRGCQLCDGSITILREDGAVLSQRKHPSTSECAARAKCGSVRIGVGHVGRVFYIKEVSASAQILRTGISFEYEPYEEWRVAQLIPTMNAMDFEHFVIDSTTYLAVANYRGAESCYGDFECFNPEGSQPLVPTAHLPYTIHSHILKQENGVFVRVQNILTRGAMDWEHFVITRTHYLVVANSFDDGMSSATTASIVYQWDGSEFVPYQNITTHGAVRWRYFKKDAGHHLAVVNSAKVLLGVLSCVRACVRVCF